MPKCEHCGFGHAMPDRCVNCGSTDPLPRRRVIKLVLSVLSVIAALSIAYYLYGRAQYFRLAEERVKPQGATFYDPSARGVPDPRRIQEGAVPGPE